jgi:4-carboxymuconolactone decarboxylase
MPRITPVADRSEIADEYQHIVDGVLEVFGAIRGPHSIMLHSPPLDERVLALGNYFRSESAVKSPQRELAIITAAREKDALYVWAAQVNASRRAGVREEAIAAVREKRDPAALLPEEAAIVTYVQQLFRKNRVDQAVFDALIERYGTQWLIDMTAVVGYYAMLGGVVNAFELPAPADGDQLPV